MIWLAASPVLAVALAVLFLPGLAVAGAAGARGFLLFAAAPATSVAVISVLAIAFPFIGVDWGVPAVLVGAALLAVIAAILHRLSAGRWSGQRAKRQPIRATWTVAAITMAAVIITIQLGIILGDPANVSQTFDAAFHLNGTKYILDTANASSFHLSGLILPEGQSSFYPAAWHGVVSLVAASSGGEILVSANMVNLAVAAVIWPTGVVALTRVLMPGNRIALLGAGLLSASVPGFPILPLDYGVLFPYFLALAFLPLALALAISLSGLTARGGLSPWPLRLLALVAALISMGLAQSAVVFAWAALLTPVLLAVVLRVWTSDRSRGVRLLVVATAAGAVLVLGVAWYVIGRLGNTSPWDAYAGVPQAIYELLSNSRQGDPPAILFSVLVVVGLVALVRSGRWWVAGMWAVAAVFFLLAAALPYGDLRNISIGLFYKDPPRLTALLATVAVPVAVVGFVAVAGWVRRTVAPGFGRRVRSRAGRVAFVVVACLLILVLTQADAMRSAVISASTKYAMTKWSPILSLDERALLERIDESVPEDAVIVGNPWTGASLAYVVGNRRVLNPHFNVSKDPAHILINMHLNEALDRQDVCDALQSANAEYVLDFGVYVRDAGGVLSFDSTTDYKGLVALEDSGVVTEVDREADKVLYEITGCG